MPDHRQLSNLRNSVPKLLNGWIAMAAIHLTLMACVSAGSVGPLTYEVNNSQVTITQCDPSVQGVMDIPAVIEGFPVTSIGPSAFYACGGITELAIPTTVTTIGYGSFSGLSISNLTIPGGVDVVSSFSFAGCNKLSSVKIMPGVKFLGNEAFGYCSKLRSLSLPDGLSAIGNETFAGCSSLENLVIPKSVTTIGVEAFARGGLRKVVMMGVIDIASGAFSYNENLKSVTFSSNLESIKSYAFNSCPLSVIELPASLKYIGWFAFDQRLLHGAQKFYFMGNAPVAEPNSFSVGVTPGRKAYAYYHYGKSGFTYPVWNGLKVDYILPNILVESSNGREIIDDFTVKRFGDVKTGRLGKYEVIRIKNDGNFRFDVLGMALSGAGKGDFVVDRLPKTTVAPGGNATFRIRFAPKKKGIRTAELRIKNTTSSIPFIIKLSGNAKK